MEANKEQAERCVILASFYMKTGELEKAQKFLEKSIGLYRLPEAVRLLVELEAARAKSGSGGSTNDGTFPRRRTANGEPERREAPKLNVDYTQEQADVVKRVQKCKDFYEVLRVSQDATDSEIKKCYKKLALQLHPDKNKAPGAIEAFKSLGNAMATLTDPSKRKTYDLYRASGAEARTTNSGRSYGNGQNGFSQPDLNPNDLFNMFFGRGFQQHQQQQHHYYRARNARADSATDNTDSRFSLLMIVLVVGVFVFSTFIWSDPVYSMQQSNQYSVERRTLNLKIPYYVKKNFLNEYQGSLGRLEYSVEEEYVTYMRRTCSNERTYRDAMIGRAKTFGSRAQFQQAQQLKMPACDNLNRLGIGKVHY